MSCDKSILQSAGQMTGEKLCSYKFCVKLAQCSLGPILDQVTNQRSFLLVIGLADYCTKFET